MTSVSVIIPCRNERDYIEACVRSLLDQEGIPDDYEIVIADGMSDDGTREVLARLAAEEPCVRVIDNPGRTACAGLNRGIAASRGEVVIRVDGHTEMARDFVRSNLELLEEHPEAWQVGGPIVHRGRGTFGRGVAAAMSSFVGVGGARHRREDYEGYAEGAVFPAMRREIFAQIGGFDEAMVRNEDEEFNFRVTRAGGKIFISPRVKHRYFVRNTIRDLYRQYEQYGYWKVAVFKKHRRLIAPRHAFPLAFVLGAPACAVATVALPPPLSLVGAVPLGAYGAMLGALFAQTAMRTGHVGVAASASAAAAVMHVAYGLGTLRGLIAFTTGAMHPGRMEEVTR